MNCDRCNVVTNMMSREVGGYTLCTKCSREFEVFISGMPISLCEEVVNE